MLTALNTPPTKKHLFILFIAAFLIRAAAMYFVVQPNGYYKQPDTDSYHMGALCLAYGNGMCTPGNNKPIFWRTPGYPLYLAFFYNMFGLKGVSLEDNKQAILAALWVQILLCSLIPILLFYLAFMLTGIYSISWLTAWISVFHLGQVLTSTYILTEGLAVIFFYLFLLFFYKIIIHNQATFKNIILSVLTLSAYTWMRPMGEPIGILATVLILLCTTDPWKTSIKNSLLFFGLFFSTLLPWYIRNYQWAQDWFFCPTSGIYFNCFCAPKIIKRTMNMNINQAWQWCQQNAQKVLYKAALPLQGTGKVLSPLKNKEAALPIIWAHPFYFIYDWIKEILKTTFDLYSSQLVKFANKTYHWDPIEEFITEKIALALWVQPIPIWMRATAWIEFFFSIVLWIGLFAGLFFFLLKPLFVQSSTFVKQMQWLWFTTGLMCGATVSMSGGFGYARLRLPIEPLMIILSLTFWYWIFVKKRKGFYETSIRPLA